MSFYKKLIEITLKKLNLEERRFSRRSTEIQAVENELLILWAGAEEVDIMAYAMKVVEDFGEKYNDVHARALKIRKRARKKLKRKTLRWTSEDKGGK